MYISYSGYAEFSTGTIANLAFPSCTSDSMSSKDEHERVSSQALQPDGSVNMLQAPLEKLFLGYF